MFRRRFEPAVYYLNNPCNPGDEPGFFFAPMTTRRRQESMSQNKKAKPPSAERAGPIRVGSPLYRLLEIIAARVAARLRRGRD